MALPSEKNYLSHIAFDSVIFGFSGQKLKILIMEYHNTGLYALPGGFVMHNEDLDLAVQRGLLERTGLDNIYLEQFHTFGNVERYKPEVMRNILQADGHAIDNDHWMLERFISVAYYALINSDKVETRPDQISDSLGWYNVEELPELILDHNTIVKTALKYLQLNLSIKPIGKNLLPNKFTMKELQQVHEAILGTPLRRTSFQRRMLGLDILERHEKRFNGKAHKAPYLYSFVE
ncbi:MAG: NUDIX hydrolase [Cytophagales bacterium CG12_big_fil_rev_8_21_14_0_65_40_12]|nr:MAG: NUDIX hydrolase [Cytophagales bacterium CG12_big_fil_rev_8_21_14_0_65_40_12]PIW03312.1 MAG: NUDIX hydrolase [Cytophagales bacterium CG17_big_fil_post_rev_8_21_14_2_50_40_13]